MTNQQTNKQESQFFFFQKRKKRWISSYKWNRFGYLSLAFLSVLSVGLFAYWWFSPLHIPNNFNTNLRILDIALFLMVSFVIWHPIMMNLLTWSISSNIKSIKRPKPAPGLKVAFITTIVPKNEPLSLLYNCLPAMVRVKYPHDTWLLDEGNSSEVRKICKLYGVKHFSRAGIPRRRFVLGSGKFAKKTKGGNHNSWYKIHGNDYDIVAQMDTDFVPKSDFLIKTLGYFKDPKVAFVGTPQIYGNIKDSLIARGAAEQQYSFYGPVLRGLCGMGMTILIGGNHIIRVAALKTVEHYSAHITEDLLTSMKLHNKGWKSVYVSYPLAVGEGPATWESYFNQQMRWAYGCMDILFNHSFKLFWKMSLRRAVYYFFLQQHYFSGLAAGISVILLTLYFLVGIRAANVDIAAFLIFYSGILFVCWSMSIWLQRFNVHRPRDAEMLLAGKIITVAVWPIWFIAFLSLLRGKRLTYKVTPKGLQNSKSISFRVFLPHFIFALFALVGIVAAFFTHRYSPLMLFWAVSSLALLALTPFLPKVVIVAWSLKNKIAKVAKRLYRLYFNPSKDHTIQFQNELTLQTFFRHTGLFDSIFLMAIVLFSFFPYFGKIGFYSDDWGFIGNFSVAANQSLMGLYKVATTPNTFMRPVQNFYDALLYFLFGINPLGYQIVNGLVLIAIPIVFYFLLRNLRFPRILAVSLPLVYILLPNYSTERFWYAVFQANLSMLFYFLSLYAGVKVIFSKTPREFLWETISIISLIISALSYEVALPLFAGNLGLFALYPRVVGRGKIGKKHTAFIVVTGITLCYIFLFKALTTTRLGIPNYFVYLQNLFVSIFHTNYVSLGLLIPYTWGHILSNYASLPLMGITFVLYMIIFWYLYHITSSPGSLLPGKTWMRNLVLISLVIFFLGYAIFITNNQIGFSPTGIENRVNIAAAIGIACSIIGIFGYIVSRVLPNRFVKAAFCIIIALICAGNFLIIATIGSFWADANQRQQVILSEIRKTFPTIQKHSTVIVDGICPYAGPAPVFESQFDLKGALQTVYHDKTIQADIVTPRLEVTKNAVITKIYTFAARYSLTNLYFYNVKTDKVYVFKNANEIASYLKTYNPDRNNNCPASHAGNGVSIF